MRGGNTKKPFLFTVIVMFILFLSMISAIFDLEGGFFKFEAFLIILFLIIAIILTYGVGKCKRWAWPGLLLFFSINWINELVIYARTTGSIKQFSLPLMITGLGFLVALIKAKPREEEFEIERYGDESEEAKTEYTPGKFVASQTGTTYHAPKCDWAKKIKKRNRVWFDSEKEAEKKGYKKHSCLK